MQSRKQVEWHGAGWRTSLWREASLTAFREPWWPLFDAQNAFLAWHGEATRRLAAAIAVLVANSADGRSGCKTSWHRSECRSPTTLGRFIAGLASAMHLQRGAIVFDRDGHRQTIDAKSRSALGQIKYKIVEACGTLL